MYCGETAERIEMPLGTDVDVGPVTKNKKGVPDPPREGGNRPPKKKKKFRPYGVPSGPAGQFCCSGSTGRTAECLPCLMAISSLAVSYLCGQLSSCSIYIPVILGIRVEAGVNGFPFYCTILL